MMRTARLLEAPEHLQEASRLLRPYGINVACVQEDAGPALLLTRTLPRNDVEYRQVLSDMGPEGASCPRLMSSYRRGELRVLVYEGNPAQPVVEVVARPGPAGITITVQDGSVFPRVAVGGRGYRLAEGEPTACGCTSLPRYPCEEDADGGQCNG